MKRTIGISLGAMDFTIEEDAHSLMNNYLDDIESRLMPYDAKDVLDDVEMRIADIFSSKLTGSSQVVTTQIVRAAIDTIGDPSNFGGRRYGRQGGASAQEPMKKLYRSRHNQVFGGVCSGIAEFFVIDMAVVRLVTFLLMFFGGLSIWIYIILWIVLPIRPLESDYFNHNKDRR